MFRNKRVDILVLFGRSGPPAQRSNAGCHCLLEQEDLGFGVVCWERKAIRAEKIADGRVPLPARSGYISKNRGTVLEKSRRGRVYPAVFRRTAALDPGAWYNTAQEGGCRFMAAWAREEENASNQRQKKREAEEADKVEVAPGVTVASLRRFRTALIGPTQGLPKRRRLCR